MENSIADANIFTVPGMIRVEQPDHEQLYFRDLNFLDW